MTLPATTPQAGHETDGPIAQNQQDLQAVLDYLAGGAAPGGAAGGDLTGTYPDPSLAAVGTAGTYTQVTTDTKGRVISGSSASTGGYTAVTGDYTATSSDWDLVVTTLSANLTITLPSASSAGAGRAYRGKDGAGTAGTGKIVKIAPSGSDTIDGAAAIVLFDNYGECTLVSDGASAWYVVSGSEHVGPDPRSISGLKVWFDSMRGVTTFSNSESVTAWSDQSGNGLDLTNSAGTTYPVFGAGLTRRPLLYFDGTDDDLRTSATTTFSSGGVTCFAIISHNDWITGAWRGFIGCNYAPAGNGWAMLRSGAVARTMRIGFNTVTPVDATYMASPANGMIAESPHLFTGRGGSASPSPVIRVNGREILNLTAAVNTSAMGTTGANYIYIGQTHYNGANADYWKGGISEIVCFDAVLTDAQCALVETYLARKHLRGAP